MNQSNFSINEITARNFLFLSSELANFPNLISIACFLGVRISRSEYDLHLSHMDT